MIKPLLFTIGTTKPVPTIRDAADWVRLYGHGRGIPEQLRGKYGYAIPGRPVTLTKEQIAEWRDGQRDIRQRAIDTPGIVELHDDRNFRKSDVRGKTKGGNR